MVVFLIPVVWYLFLQLFGSNKFELVAISSVDEQCAQFESLTVSHRAINFDPAQQSHFNRVQFKTKAKKVSLVADTLGMFNCLSISEVLLLTEGSNVWGAYDLDREGVDRLLTEMDIVLLQKTYGEGVSR